MPAGFARGEAVLAVDGYIPSDAGTTPGGGAPAVDLLDAHGNVAFGLDLDSVLSTANVRSSRTGGYREPLEASFVAGAHVSLRVSVGPDGDPGGGDPVGSLFSLSVNGHPAGLGPYAVPGAPGGLDLDRVSVVGDVEVTFAGFAPAPDPDGEEESGWSPSVAVGTAVTYACPDGWFFKEDLNVIPRVRR